MATKTRRRSTRRRGTKERDPRELTTDAEITVDAARLISLVLLVAIGIEVFLVLADAFINVAAWIDIGPIRRYFNITREDALASWFGVIQTWMAGLTAGAIYMIVRRRDAPRWSRIGWLVMTLFLLYVALDDGTELHERIGSAAKEVFGDVDAETGGLGIFPSYPWQVVFGPIFAAAGIFVLWFLFRELTERRDRVVVVAAVALLAGAVLIDFFEGLDTDHTWNLQGYIIRNSNFSAGDVRHFAKSVEEFMEMLAITLIWTVLLRHLMRLAPTTLVRFESQPSR